MILTMKHQVTSSGLKGQVTAQFLLLKTHPAQYRWVVFAFCGLLLLLLLLLLFIGKPQQAFKASLQDARDIS